MGGAIISSCRCLSLLRSSFQTGASVVVVVPCLEASSTSSLRSNNFHTGSSVVDFLFICIKPLVNSCLRGGRKQSRSVYLVMLPSLSLRNCAFTTLRIYGINTAGLLYESSNLSDALPENIKHISVKHNCVNNQHTQYCKQTE